MTTDASTTPVAARTLDDNQIFVHADARDHDCPKVVVQSVQAGDLPADLDETGEDFHLAPDEAETLADALRAAARHATGRAPLRGVIR